MDEVWLVERFGLEWLRAVETGLTRFVRSLRGKINMKSPVLPMSRRAEYVGEV